jgi:Holliday junction DNA helicase RuvA
MIGKLTGIIDGIGSDYALIDVNGVGYVVHASARVLARIGSVGTPVQLQIETQVREVAITLFGFSDLAERDWFRLLTTVQGVGAKVALSIQGIMSSDELAVAIASQDKTSLTRASGVGPKLGSRIVAELKDKVAGIAAIASIGTTPNLPSSVAQPQGPIEDAVSALVNLGYKRLDAFSAVAKAQRESTTPQSLDQLIRAGLRSLSQ